MGLGGCTVNTARPLARPFSPGLRGEAPPMGNLGAVLVRVR